MEVAIQMIAFKIYVAFSTKMLMLSNILAVKYGKANC